MVICTLIKSSQIKSTVWVYKIAFALFIFSILQLNAQSEISFPLNQKSTKILVDSLAAQIKKYYVFKESAVKMSDFLKKRYLAGAYSTVKDPYVLAGLLTADVRSIHNDEHFNVEFNPGIANEISGNVEDVPKMVADKLKIEQSKNFGFKKVEILNGNVGYLEISSFSRLNDYSKVAVRGALSFLSSSRAIIIDLRYGMGGSPEMVNYILGFFLKERTHIADIFIRSENATLTYWVNPETDFQNLKTIPLYILVSYKTFSAAEGLAYELQSIKRATLIGETSRGGAHTVTYRPLSSGFISDIPFGRAISPITKTNWEGTGVIPDIKTSNEQALEIGHLKIIEEALTTSKDTLEKHRLNIQKLCAENLYHPITIDSLPLKSIAGNYGCNTITFNSSKLYFQKKGKAKFELQALNENLFRLKGNETFVLYFEAVDASSKKNRMIILYEDGSKEIALLTE